MTAPVQRRVENLEAEAFRAERRHDELVGQLDAIREKQGDHATAIAAALVDTRDIRTDVREIKRTLAAIVAHMGIEVPPEPE